MGANEDENIKLIKQRKRKMNVKKKKPAQMVAHEKH